MSLSTFFDSETGQVVVSMQGDGKALFKSLSPADARILAHSITTKAAMAEQYNCAGPVCLHCPE